jgi:hypothetical protein
VRPYGLPTHFSPEVAHDLGRFMEAPMTQHEGYTEVELTVPEGIGVSLQLRDGRVSQYRAGSVLISGYEPYESVELTTEQMDTLCAWWLAHRNPPSD